MTVMPVSRAVRRLPLLPLAAALALALLAAVFRLLQPGAVQAGGVVTNCADDSQLTSLLAGGGLVTFDCGPGAVTITLSGEKVIAADTTVDGGGLVALSGAGLTRHFSVTSGARLVLLGLTLNNGLSSAEGGAIFSLGRLELDQVTVYSNSAAMRGGGLYLAGGSALIERTTFLSNNSGADCCGAVYSAAPLTITGATFENNRTTGTEGAGALGLALAQPGQWALVRDTQFVSNSTAEAGKGGAIAVWAGRLQLVNTIFERNTASLGQVGGAVYADGGAQTHIQGSRFLSNAATHSGGAIYNDFSAALLITDTLFTANTAITGSGAAIANYGSLAVNQAEFHRNSGANGEADGGGGGIYTDIAGRLSVRASRFVENHSTYEGGAIDGVNATVEDSVFLSNTARYGGAIGYYDIGYFSINRSAFVGNAVVSTTSGAPIEGGAVDTNGFRGMWITNSVFYQNRAEGLAAGGALHADAAPVTVTHSTFVENSAPANKGGAFSGAAGVVLRNSLVSNNTGGNCEQPLNFAGANVQFGDATCGTASIEQDPLLSLPLVFANGQMPVIALLAGSPAINAAEPAYCPLYDQRGQPRPAGLLCDVGAYEAGWVFWLPFVPRTEP